MTPSLDKIKEILQKYFISQPISKAWIFGSYARGEQTSDSDIDILVDFSSDCKLSLFTLSSIILDLEKLSGKKIDLVDHNRIFPEIAPFIEADKILVYERD